MKAPMISSEAYQDRNVTEMWRERCIAPLMAEKKIERESLEIVLLLIVFDNLFRERERLNTKGKIGILGLNDRLNNQAH